MKIGIDSVDISRIEKLLEKKNFLTRVFSEEEQKEFLSRGNKPQHIAAAFAAKEAFSKAMGTGIVGFSLNEVSLLHKENGKPFLSFSGRAEELTVKNGFSFDVSVTHTDTLATVIVIAF
ncbi:MAG: holo-ACP synthase [Clostridia bacterium]|nr:holo-ACP synthase [Clostridia bacterium]